MTERQAHDQPTLLAHNDRAIGPVGSAARTLAGLALVSAVLDGELTTHLTPLAWALGLVGFPLLALAGHSWWARRHPAPITATGVRISLLGVTLLLALYFTWWYAPPLAATSDGVMLFYGVSLLLAAIRGAAGCEVLAVSNWLLQRHDQIACVVFFPIDALERRER